MIVELAERQHGVVARWQLLAAGLTDQVIKTRVATRRLFRIHEGVFSLTRQPGQRGLFAAAILASAGGHVSHRSALALWDLRAQTSGPVHVTITYGRSLARAGVRTHETRNLPAEDRAAIDCIPCTNWPRTLLDVAGATHRHDLRALLERSQVLRIFDASALHAALERGRGKRGVRKLRAVLTELDDDVAPTRSELERAFLQVVRDAGLPSPITNGLVCGYEVDFHWPDAKLIVEADGRTIHGTPLAFERDRQRDLELKLAGWDVVRVTWRQVRDAAHHIVALLRAKLHGVRGRSLRGEP